MRGWHCCAVWSWPEKAGRTATKLRHFCWKRAAWAGLAPGQPADFVLVDLEHPALAGWNKTTLGPSLALSSPADAVREVWVGGTVRVRDRQHEALPAAQREFNLVCQRVLA
jgi:hypothetical protein